MSAEGKSMERDLKGASGRGHNGCLIAAVVVAALAFLATLLVALILIAIGSAFGRSTSMSTVRMGRDEYPIMKEVWSCGAGDVKVIRIPIKGTIFLGEEQGMFGAVHGPADIALMSIRRATRDPKVRAIILDIDSGGGGITASDILLKALLEFKQQDSGRKVVAVFGDVAASGAYYISLGADRILARPTTITGSIGVLIQALNVRELGDKIGVKGVTIKSGKFKDTLNPFGEMSNEQLAILQGIVDSMLDRFVGLVVRHRAMSDQQVRQIADGRVFLAEEAVELGLVDGRGYWQDAMREAASLLNVSQIKVYRYDEEFSLAAFVKAFRGWDPVGRLTRSPGHPRVLYLWDPM